MMAERHINCFLCKYSLPEWYAAIEAHAEILKFKKGELIFKEGQPVTGVYFIHSGKAKVHKQWGEEKDLIIKFAKAGEVLGHRGIGSNNEYPVSATAIENMTACFVTNDFFKASLKVNNELTYQMMLAYAYDLQEAERSMRNLVHMPVKNRIADALLKIADMFGLDIDGYIDTTLTKQDIASYAGTIYETLFKVMNEFISDGLIEMSGKNILIRNRNGLLALIEPTR